MFNISEEELIRMINELPEGVILNVKLTKEEK